MFGDADRSKATSNVQHKATAAAGEDVGKRALTDGAQPGGGVHAAAARGTASPSGELPHRDQIQKLFGRHDISGIQAHTGADAEASADEMGAQAYATGDHVVLGKGNDLHTVAHEAAHVVQQRGGVQLKGGVGQAGDAHEQHADRVADAVVAGQSAEALLDTVAPAGGKPASSQAPVQHKLKVGNKVATKAADLGLPSGKAPSAPVSQMLASPAVFYPEVAADFEAPQLHVLEHKKYILGEQHGDGTFAARTARWPGVQTMKEGIKGMSAQSPAENKALGTAGQDVAGQDKGQGLPLEDSHAYTMTRMLFQQQMMNKFDDLMLLASGEDLVQDGLAEVAVMIGQYADVGLAWCKQLGERPAEGTRGAHFMGVGFDPMTSELFKKVIAPVAQKKKATKSLTKAERAQIQTMLQGAIGHLLELIDTRPMGGGFMGMFQSKQGADPISNRADINNLATPGNTAPHMADAIDAGHPVREAAMIANIKAAPAPLFVQIGDNHVDRVAAGVGAEAVKVKVGADFDALTQKP